MSFSNKERMIPNWQRRIYKRIKTSESLVNLLVNRGNMAAKRARSTLLYILFVMTYHFKKTPFDIFVSFKLYFSLT